MPPPSSTAAPPSSGDEPPALPKSTSTALPWPGLDRLGFTQAIGGLALGLIALFSSYDHLSIAGLNIALPQQWGIPLIALSVAIIFIDAQLATRSRLRAAEDAARAAEAAARAADERKSDRDRAEQRENEADRERNRADQERNRAAEARERQAESLERIRQAVVLSARVQLDPSDTNRARLQTFLTLLSQSAPEDPDL